MSSTDISTIKNLKKIKCQEIPSFRYNQKLPLASAFLVGQELYTNPQVADNSSNYRIYTELLPKRFITSESRKQGHDISWVCLRSLLSSVKVTEMHVCMLVFFHSFLHP